MDRSLIDELARRYGAPAPERRHAANMMLQCPLAADPTAHPPTDKGSASFSVEVTEGASRCHCFRCGVGGSLAYVFELAQERCGGFELALEFIRSVERSGFSAALARCRGVRLQADELGPVGSELERYAAFCFRNGVHQSLIDRGILRGDVTKWRIGYDPEIRRSTFPCRDELGRLVGVCRRATTAAGPKWHDEPRGKWKGTLFYGEEFIDPTLEHVRLVEGPTSTVFATRVLRNVLGNLGAGVGITRIRLAKLRRWAKVITLIMDGDQAGRDAVYGKQPPRGKRKPGLLEILRPYFVVRVAELPDGGDPASVPREVLREADAAASALRFRVGRRGAPPMPSHVLNPHNSFGPERDVAPQGQYQRGIDPQE